MLSTFEHHKIKKITKIEANRMKTEKNEIIKKYSKRLSEVRNWTPINHKP